MVTGVVPSPPRFLRSIFIAHRVQQSHCSSIFHRVLLTHALALSASQFVRKKKSPRIYTSMHSGGFELTKLTYTRLEDILIRHRGDRLYYLAGTRAKTRTHHQDSGAKIVPGRKGLGSLRYVIRLLMSPSTLRETRASMSTASPKPPIIHHHTWYERQTVPPKNRDMEY